MANIPSGPLDVPAEAFGLVDSQFDTARDYAGTSFTAAIGFLEALKDQIEGNVVPDTTITLPTLPNPITLPGVPTAPADPNIKLDSELVPKAPGLDSFPTLTSIDIETFSEPIPTIISPIKPDPLAVTVPTEPSLSDLGNSPDSPDVTVPTLPTIQDIVIPSIDDVNVPEFDTAVPDVTTLTPPSNVAFTFDAFESSLISAVNTKILYTFNNGGDTGITATVEDAIYARETARRDAELQESLDQAEDFYASRGFSSPPGALSAKHQRMLTEWTRSNDRINNEIIINQTKLAQQQEQFNTTLAVQADKMLRDFFLGNNTLLYQAHNSFIQNGIALYQAQIGQLNLQIEVFKAQALAYESTIKGALARVQQQELAIRAALAQGEINKLRVDIYRAQLDGLKTTVELYKAELEAYSLRYQIEGLKLERYKTQIQAYVAQVQAKTAEFEAYGKEWEGEKTKAEVYEAQVKAYTAKVTGKMAQLQAEVSKIEAVAAKNKGLIDKYGMQIEEYKASTHANVIEYEGKIKKYGYQLEAYKAGTQVYSAEAQALIAQYRGQVDSALMQLRANIAEMEITVKAWDALQSLAVEGQKAGASVGAQIAAAALQSANASAGFSYSGSESNAYGQYDNISYDGGTA